MHLLDSLANAFINTFGITQPTAQTRRRASWFILALVLLAFLAALVAGSLIYQMLHSQGVRN